MEKWLIESLGLWMANIESLVQYTQTHIPREKKWWIKYQTQENGNWFFRILWKCRSHILVAIIQLFQFHKQWILKIIWLVGIYTYLGQISYYSNHFLGNYMAKIRLKWIYSEVVNWKKWISILFVLISNFMERSST